MTVCIFHLGVGTRVNQKGAALDLELQANMNCLIWVLEAKLWCLFSTGQQHLLTTKLSLQSHWGLFNLSHLHPASHSSSQGLFWDDLWGRWDRNMLMLGFDGRALCDFQSLSPLTIHAQRQVPRLPTTKAGQSLAVCVSVFSPQQTFQEP